MEEILEKPQNKAAVTPKRYVDTDIEEMCDVLIGDYIKEAKALFARKFDYDSDSRWHRIFNKTEKTKISPKPSENDYLRTIITYLYDYMNGNEKMPFEQIQNL
jgi:hypothetical protein